MKPIQLENRLIQFVIDIILVSKTSDTSFASEHSAKQLSISATTATLNYSESGSGALTRDFLYKIKICLKELRESYIS